MTCSLICQGPIWGHDKELEHIQSRSPTGGLHPEIHEQRDPQPRHLKCLGMSVCRQMAHFYVSNDALARPLILSMEFKYRKMTHVLVRRASLAHPMS